MGKYIKVAKNKGEAAASMEAPHQSTLGVRTRAKTLALQRLQRSSMEDSSYLQLRSRRLEKPPVPNPKSPNPNPSPSLNSTEVSFGENILEVEARSRNARETTPCSLIRNPEAVETPGSTTRPTCSIAANRRAQNSTRRNIPTLQEMEQLFSGVEQLQQCAFAEKYNFDPVNDVPLPGRYEWVRVDDE